jgi:predicted Fe-S protein YdhL (DUF1289 family)
MRLKTLITLRLNPPEKYWQDTSNAFNSLLGYKNLVNVCDKLGLIKDIDTKALRDLWDKRCRVAHETELWKNISPKEREEINRLCHSAIDFLNKTTKYKESQHSRNPCLNRLEESLLVQYLSSSSNSQIQVQESCLLSL